MSVAVPACGAADWEYTWAYKAMRLHLTEAHLCAGLTGTMPVLDNRNKMKIIGLILSLTVLAACDPSYKPRPEPASDSGGSGISISGYGRVGISTRH